jgi:hypothetical protein
VTYRLSKTAKYVGKRGIRKADKQYTNIKSALKNSEAAKCVLYHKHQYRGQMSFVVQGWSVGFGRKRPRFDNPARQVHGVQVVDAA